MVFVLKKDYVPDGATSHEHNREKVRSQSAESNTNTVVPMRATEVQKQRKKSPLGRWC